jgi:N-acetylmuramoyl-L-alanine amidase
MGRFLRHWGEDTLIAMAAVPLVVSSVFPQARRPPVAVRSAMIAGSPCLSLEDVASAMSGYLHWHPVTNRVDLLFRGHAVQFIVGSDQAVADGRAERLDAAPVKNGEGVWVALSFFRDGSLSRYFHKRMEFPDMAARAPAQRPFIEKSAPAAPLPVGSEEAAPAPVTQATQGTHASQAASPAPVRSAAAVVAPAPVAEPMEKRHAVCRIVIDPGHGGKDPGAQGPNGIVEKAINLTMAQDLADALRAQDYEVLLTRTDDSFVPLADRAALANKYHADLFISLHCNASLSSQLHGFEVYFLSEYASDPHASAVAQMENAPLALEDKPAQASPHVQRLLRSLAKNVNINASSELGTLIDRQVTRRLSESDLGVKQAAFYVLRGAEMPAILIEMAFLSNRSDERALRREAFRRRMVEAIVAGIQEYDRRHQRASKQASRRVRNDDSQASAQTPGSLACLLTRSLPL